jgi:two-component system C4-dicarboxylate transport sensor histidine kinase DctB
LRTVALTVGNEQLEAQLQKLRVTESLLRSTQNEMLQAGKLAMLGQMAAGITHELNQPLTAIRAFADNAGVFLARGNAQQASANLQHISDASARMGALIAQLKSYSRKSSELLSVVDVAQSIHAAAAILRSEFERQGAQLEICLNGESAQVLGDSIRLEQVLINLIHNALDALDAVEPAELKKVTVVLVQDADTVSIRIMDNGIGLADQVLQHLFEPFFTTKPSGSGLGLGLSISASIVQAMNGQLLASNREQGGAEFVLHIPRHAS